LRNVKYADELILAKAGMPVVRVKYVKEMVWWNPFTWFGSRAESGRCGPFQDRLRWQDLVPIANCGDQKICMESSTQNNVKWLELGIYARIGEYHLYQAWHLSDDGELRPQRIVHGVESLEEKAVGAAVDVPPPGDHEVAVRVAGHGGLVLIRNRSRVDLELSADRRGLRGEALRRKKRAEQQCDTPADPIPPLSATRPHGHHPRRCVHHLVGAYVFFLRALPNCVNNENRRGLPIVGTAPAASSGGLRCTERLLVIVT